MRHASCMPSMHLLPSGQWHAETHRRRCRASGPNVLLCPGTRQRLSGASAAGGETSVNGAAGAISSGWTSTCKPRAFSSAKVSDDAPVSCALAVVAPTANSTAIVITTSLWCVSIVIVTFHALRCFCSSREHARCPLSWQPYLPRALRIKPVILVTPCSLSQQPANHSLLRYRKSTSGPSHTMRIVISTTQHAESAVPGASMSSIR